MEGTLIIIDLKRNKLGRTEISEYTPTPMNSLVTLSPSWPCAHFRLGRRSERLSRRLVNFENGKVIDKGNYRIRKALESWHTAITAESDNNSKPLPEQCRILLNKA